MPAVNINNIKVYYEIHGSGAPLLLTAGLGCDSQDWTGIIEELSNHFQLISFDNRGAGRSLTPDKSFTILDMADDAVKLLDYLDIHSAHIIGHSMGGYIALQIAINYPEYVSKLILESTAPISSVRNNLLFKSFHKWLKNGMDFESWIRAWSFWLFSPKRFEDGEFINNYIKGALGYPYKQSIDGFNYQIEAISSFDVRKELGSIKAETLVIEGKEDMLILPREAKVLIDRIPKACFVEIEGAAHRVHTENPKIFNQTVLKFLSSSNNLQ